MDMPERTDAPNRTSITSSDGVDWGDYLKSTPTLERAGKMRGLLIEFCVTVNPVLLKSRTSKLLTEIEEAEEARLR